MRSRPCFSQGGRPVGIAAPNSARSSSGSESERGWSKSNVFARTPVSTIATEQRSLWRSSAIGFCWGIGHTLVLLLAGLTILSFKLTISGEWVRLFEAAVGLMLVGLGVSVGLTLWRERLHVHAHAH